jgi:hypothetical protein
VLVYIIKKDGNTEKYDLRNDNERAIVEKKYGPLPYPPPQPPAVPGVSSSPVTVAGVAIASVSNPVTVAGVEIAPAQASSVTVAKVARATVVPSSIAVASSPDIAVVAGNVTIADEAGNVMTGDEAIVITITKNTSRQELDEFVKQMKAKGVEMTYDEIEYDSNGILVNISGSLKSKTGHSNFVGQGFGKLVFALLKKGEKTWFKVSVTDGKAVI